MFNVQDAPPMRSAFGRGTYISNYEWIFSFFQKSLVYDK